MQIGQSKIIANNHGFVQAWRAGAPLPAAGHKTGMVGQQPAPKARGAHGILRPCESSVRLSQNQRFYAAFPGHRADPRILDRQRVRRQRRHRRLFCRLPDSQPVAAPVCRRRIFAGLRPDTGGDPQARRRSRNRLADRSHRDHPGRDPARRVGAGRAALAGHRLAHGARFQRPPGKVRPDGADAAHHLSLHFFHCPDRLRRRDTQHLGALFDSRLHPGAAQPLFHCLHTFCRAVFSPRGHGAGLGRGLRRNGAADPAVVRADARRAAAALPLRLEPPGGAAHPAADGTGAARRLGGADQPPAQHHHRLGDE